MVYLVYNKDEEFVDVFDFNRKDWAMYKMSHPSHIVEPESTISRYFLVREDFEDNQNIHDYSL